MPKKHALVAFLLLFATTIPSPAQSASEQEQNKNVTRIFFEEVLGRGKLEKYSESHTSDFVAHGGARDYTLAEDLGFAREERTAMPDMQIVVDQMVAEADLVAARWTAWGTNTQPAMGLPATGKKIRISGITIFRFKAGKISEEWSAWNMLSVLKQAGLYPPNK